MDAETGHEVTETATYSSSSAKSQEMAVKV